jgi:hypothetical protein
MTPNWQSRERLARTAYFAPGLRHGSGSISASRYYRHRSRSLPMAALQVNCSSLIRLLALAHAHRVRGNRWADDPATIAEMKRKAPEAVTDGFDLIAQQMLKGP